jgi:hypothetical protein
MRNIKSPNFSGVFLYCGMSDPDDRVLVLAVAGYKTYQDAARELEINEHQAKYLWKYLKKRDALYEGNNYNALEAWAEEE